MNLNSSVRRNLLSDLEATMDIREAVVVQQIQQLVKLAIAICQLVDGALMVGLLCLDVALGY